jgi:hypothetical protein
MMRDGLQTGLAWQRFRWTANIGAKNSQSCGNRDRKVDLCVVGSGLSRFGNDRPRIMTDKAAEQPIKSGA